MTHVSPTIALTGDRNVTVSISPIFSGLMLSDSPLTGSFLGVSLMFHTPFLHSYGRYPCIATAFILK